MNTRLIAGMLWGVWSVLCVATGLVMLKACGLSLPGIGPLVSACAAPAALTAATPADRTAALTAEVTALERSLAAAGACRRPPAP